MFSFELGALVRVLVAAFLGGLIGLERQLRGRPAGLRTHILVCVGAALIMLVSKSLGEGLDPGRAIAGIVTGIGFLGAGVVVKSREIVRGLTTAACIWFVAALGIVVGQGLYVLAAGCTAVALVVLILLARMEHYVPAVSYHTAHIYGRSVEPNRLAQQCQQVFSTAAYRVMGMKATITRDDEDTTLVFRVRARSRPQSLRTIESLLAIPEVVRVEWE